MPQGAKDWECLNRKSPGVSALGFNPAHAEKALPENNMISDSQIAYGTNGRSVKTVANTIAVHSTMPISRRIAI